TEPAAVVVLREYAQPVTANLHRQQFALLPLELVDACHGAGHNNTVTLVRVEHVDEFGVLVPERHIVGGGAEVFPGAVIVLLRPACEDLNVSYRLTIDRVVANIVSDTTVDLNACICHCVFLLQFCCMKIAPTVLVRAGYCGVRYAASVLFRGSRGVAL